MLFPAQQNIQGLPLTDIALADSLAIFDNSASANQRITVERLLAFFVPVCGRLTTESGVPISTSDRTSQSTLYFTPYQGNVVKLYDGTRWKLYAFTEISKSLTSLTSGLPYDVFLYDSSGTLTLEFVAWTTGTARATPLTTQNGTLVKAGDTTRLYLGTFRTTSSSTTEDSAARRFLWNYYNRAERPLKKFETTNTWSYSTAAWRAANNSTGNRVELLVGWNEVMLDIEVCASMFVDNSEWGSVGICEDNTNTSHADLSYPPYNTGTSNVLLQAYARLKKNPAVGHHFYQWTEYCGNGNPTWYGTYSNPTLRQAGLCGSIWG